MVASWPNSVAKIAKEIGITGKELQWFLSYRTDLQEPFLGRLLSLMRISYESFGYEATGPCVLIAKAPQAISEAYEELGHGGDLAYSFEALPEKGIPDPSWRYVVFQAIGGSPNIIMVPRGTKVGEQVNAKLFINFGGQQEISAAAYRDIVKTCAKACATPSANFAEMQGFVKRQADYLQDFERE